MNEVGEFCVQLANGRQLCCATVETSPDGVESVWVRDVARRLVDSVQASLWGDISHGGETMTRIMRAAIGGDVTAGYHGHSGRLTVVGAAALDDATEDDSERYYEIDGEAIVVLANGGSIRLASGPRTDYVRICHSDGGEEAYWCVDEWCEDGEAELVMGAIMGAAGSVT